MDCRALKKILSKTTITTALVAVALAQNSSSDKTKDKKGMM